MQKISILVFKNIAGKKKPHQYSFIKLYWWGFSFLTDVKEEKYLLKRFT